MTEPIDEPLLRFDLYTLTPNKSGGHNLIRMLENLSFPAASIISGVDTKEFVTAIANGGWFGTCPAWHRYIPIVILPHGENVDHDHLRYITERI